jgi:muconolactone D-isomerase
MDYLVEFIITIPDDAPLPEIEQRLAGETTRVAELAAQGHALRVWKPLPEDGRQRALGLYRAASDEELEAILDSLPLRPWMEISVTALAEHPNDPAVGSMSAANRPTMGALPDPELRHAYRLDPELDAPADLGDTPQGHRRIIPLTRGHAEGPTLTLSCCRPAEPTGRSCGRLAARWPTSATPWIPTPARRSTSSPEAFAMATRTWTRPRTRSVPR